MCIVPFIHGTGISTPMLLPTIIQFEATTGRSGRTEAWCLLPPAYFLHLVSLESLFRHQFRFSKRGRLSDGNYAGLLRDRCCYFCRLLSILLTGLQLTTPLNSSIGNLGTEKANCTDGIVVSGDGVVHLVGVAVRVGQSDDGNFQTAGL